HTPYLMTLKNSRPLPEFEEYAFLACNPKEYDGKGGAIVYTRWIEKMESVQDMSRCRDNKNVKYIAGMSWEDFKTLTREEFCPSNEIQKLGSELGITPMVQRPGHAAILIGMVAATEPKTIQKAVQIAGTLTDEALRNGSIKRTMRKEEMEGNLARIGMQEMTTKGLGLEILLL
ncbi:hypothetical protein Tco_0853338, partial [Tanacetum coccineum]